jgi:hypothetical protein
LARIDVDKSSYHPPISKSDTGSLQAGPLVRMRC